MNGVLPQQNQRCQRNEADVAPVEMSFTGEQPFGAVQRPGHSGTFRNIIKC
ncbi:MAG: hypothetical protein ACFE0J_24480 [Elainellaceae cyanobacterium]